MTDWTWEKHHVFSEGCTNSTGQMELPRVDQPQAPDTVEKMLRVYKVESCQQQRRFSSCKHLSLVCELVSVSTVKVRVLAPLNRTACLFLSLQFSLITVELSFSNMHPSITIYFTSTIHTFLCIIPSGGFTYCTYPHALGQLLRTIKWHYSICLDLTNSNTSFGSILIFIYLAAVAVICMWWRLVLGLVCVT